MGIMDCAMTLLNIRAAACSPLAQVDSTCMISRTAVTPNDRDET